MDLSDSDGLSQEDLKTLSEFPMIQPMMMTDPDLKADVTIMDQVIAGKTCQDTWNQLLLEEGQIDLETDFNHGFFLEGMNMFVEGARKMAEGMSMMRLASAASTIPDMTKVMAPILEKMTDKLKPPKVFKNKARGNLWVPPVDNESLQQPEQPKDEGKVKSEPTTPTKPMPGIETAMTPTAALMYQQMQLDRPPRPQSEPTATVTSSGTPPVIPKRRKRKLPNPDATHFAPVVGRNTASLNPDGTAAPKPVTVYVNGKKKAQCSACGFTKSYDAVESHIHRDHLNISFKCNYCPKTSYSRHTLNTHMNTCDARPAMTKVDFQEPDVKAVKEMQLEEVNTEDIGLE